MKALVIDYKKIQAVKPFIAKKDPRPCLHGVHINVADGMLEASDGHRCIRVDINEELDALGENKHAYEGMIFTLPAELKGNVKNGTTVTIDAENKTIIATTKGVSVQHALNTIDDVFPNTNQILPKRSQVEAGEENNLPVCLDSTYLAALEKAFGKNVGIVFLSIPTTYSSAVLVAPEDTNNYWRETTVAIMPRYFEEAGE